MREIRRVKTGFWPPPDSEIWTVSFCCGSFNLRAPEGVTRTRTLGLELRVPEPFPPSKYSIRREVWEFWEREDFEGSSLSRCLHRVGIVTGLPSSGTE